MVQSTINISKEIPVEADYDVFIAGAGMAGVTAAVFAARAGLKVGIAEYFGEPGGIPVSGRLGSISGFSRRGVDAVGGFALKLARELEKQGKAFDQNGSNINIAPAALSAYLSQLLKDQGIDIYYYHQVIDAVRSERFATHVVTASKSGLRAFSAKLFIDDTGDGDLAAQLGCRFMKGRESDGKVQSASLIFIVGGIELDRLPDYMEVRRIWKSKPREIPMGHTVFQFVPNCEKSNEIAVNMVHILNCDCSNAEDLSRVRTEGIEQAEYILDFFRTEIPGFENAFINQFAPQAGVRETRRILGDYILTEDDVVSSRHFSDEIAQGIWGIDVHSPDGVHTGIDRYIEQPYGIPYRCITPCDIDNLYVVGRPISADHVAHSSSRINATCMALGQAAGTAAAMAIKAGSIRKVDVAELRRMLLADDALIH